MKNLIHIFIGMLVGGLLLSILVGVNRLCNDDREQISDDKLIAQVIEIIV